MRASRVTGTGTVLVIAHMCRAAASNSNTLEFDLYLCKVEGLNGVCKLSLYE